MNKAYKINNIESCPSWARGLKYAERGTRTHSEVVPLVGTWIEIRPVSYLCGSVLSCPSWARGLKYIYLKEVV